MQQFPEELEGAFQECIRYFKVVVENGRDGSFVNEPVLEPAEALKRTQQGDVRTHAAALSSMGPCPQADPEKATHTREVGLALRKQYQEWIRDHAPKQEEVLAAEEAWKTYREKVHNFADALHPDGRVGA